MKTRLLSSTFAFIGLGALAFGSPSALAAIPSLDESKAALLERHQLYRSAGLALWIEHSAIFQGGAGPTSGAFEEKPTLYISPYAVAAIAEASESLLRKSPDAFKPDDRFALWLATSQIIISWWKISEIMNYPPALGEIIHRYGLNMSNFLARLKVPLVDEDTVAEWSRISMHLGRGNTMMMEDYLVLGDLSSRAMRNKPYHDHWDAILKLALDPRDPDLQFLALVKLGYIAKFKLDASVLSKAGPELKKIVDNTKVSRRNRMLAAYIFYTSFPNKIKDPGRLYLTVPAISNASDHVSNYWVDALVYESTKGVSGVEPSRKDTSILISAPLTLDLVRRTDGYLPSAVTAEECEMLAAVRARDVSAGG